MNEKTPHEVYKALLAENIEILKRMDQEAELYPELKDYKFWQDHRDAIIKRSGFWKEMIDKTK